MGKSQKCISCGGTLRGADQSFTFTCTSCYQKRPKDTRSLTEIVNDMFAKVKRNQP